MEEVLGVTSENGDEFILFVLLETNLAFVVDIIKIFGFISDTAE